MVAPESGRKRSPKPAPAPELASQETGGLENLSGPKDTKPTRSGTGHSRRPATASRDIIVLEPDPSWHGSLRRAIEVPGLSATVDRVDTVDALGKILEGQESNPIVIVRMGLQLRMNDKPLSSLKLAEYLLAQDVPVMLVIGRKFDEPTGRAFDVPHFHAWYTCDSFSEVGQAIKQMLAANRSP